MKERVGDNIRSGMFWTFMERIGTKIVQFALQLLLARILVPEDYGLCALLLAFINIATVLVNSGLNTALIQKKNADSLDFSSVLYLSLGISIAIYVLLFFISPLIAEFFNDTRLCELMRVLSITLVIGAFNSVQLTVLYRKMQFRKLFIANLSGMIVSAVISIGLALMGYGVWSIVIQYLVNRIVITITLFFLVRWIPMLEFSWIRIKSLFNFGWKCMASTFLSTIVTDIYTAVVGKFYTKAQLGTYDTGNKIPSTVSETFTSSLGSVLFPAFSKIQDDIPKLRGLVVKSNKVSSFLIAPIMLALLATAHPLVTILLTEKWIGAVPFLQMACVLYAFYPLHVANIQAINAIGKSGTALNCEIQKKIVDLGFLALMVHFSIYWVALGRVLTSIISLWINMRPNVKFLQYKVQSQIRDVMPTFMIAILMCAAMCSVNLMQFVNTYVELIVKLVIGGIVYFGLSYIFNRKTIVYEFKIVMKKNN